MNGYAALLDVTQYPPRFKHEAIFAVFETLAPGLAMEIINDHDPKPLHYQLEAEYSGQFDWQYIAEGPEIWRVRLERRESS